MEQPAARLRDGSPDVTDLDARAEFADEIVQVLAANHRWEPGTIAFMPDFMQAKVCEELVRRHQHRVFAVAGGILRRREDVEDIAQQVFVKAYFSLKRFDQRAAFSTWLYKITVNECWDLLRKKKVRPLVYESDLSEEQARQVITAGDKENPGPDASEKMEARERVEQLLEGLDERDRLMLILKEVDGFSIEEIAEVLNLNGNTVKVRLFRARRRVVSRAKKRVD